MEKQEAKKYFFLGVTDEPESANRAYSNFVYALCASYMYECNKDTNSKEKYDMDFFKRHDMREEIANIKDSVYSFIAKADGFIFLADEIEKWKDSSGNEQNRYCENVWFELGLAATSNKPIILISQTASLPFYAKDISPIVLDDKLIQYLRENQTFFQSNTFVCNEGRILALENKFNDEIADRYDKFRNTLKAKINNPENPFEKDIEYSDIRKLGYGDVYTFIKSLDFNTLTKAEFIEGEEQAFRALIKEVKNAKKTLRTSRSANQSITGNNDSRNSKVHQEFMEALYEAFKKDEIEKFDRIVCNNNPLKWKDIYQMLLNGGQETCIYVRQNKYAFGFELVVIDEYVSFIHFYQLSICGDINSDDSENIPTNQVINSTLRIEGKDVGENLANIFDRFSKRDFGKNPSEDPSRTLLGIKETDDENGNKIVQNRDRGCLKVACMDVANKFLVGNPRKKENAVISYILERFDEWQDGMDIDDKINMAIGIAVITGFEDDKIRTITEKFGKEKEEDQSLLLELRRIKDAEEKRKNKGEQEVYGIDDIEKWIGIVGGVKK